MFKILYIISCFFLLSISLYSQNETGTRVLNETALKKRGSFYDSTTSMFHAKLPIIRSIPPLSTDMSYEIMHGYVYIDSIMKNISYRLTDSILASWTSLNDTLKYAIKHLYNIIDYDPYLLYQYGAEVNVKQKSKGGTVSASWDSIFFGNNQPTGLYRNSIKSLKQAVCQTFYDLIPNIDEKRALFSTVYPEVIMRVHIIDIDSCRDIYSSGGSEYRYGVTARVDEEFKGFPYTSGFASPSTELPFNNSADLSLNTPLTYTNFAFTPKCYICLGLDECNYKRPDRNFLRTSSSGFYLKEGQDIIVFLSFFNRLYDTQYDYFEITPDPMSSLNALPIVGETVLDVNHVWSQDGSLTYQQWKQVFEMYRNKIENMNY